MSESVEQAALRRGAQPITDPRVVSALESMGKIVEADGRMHKMLAAQCAALGQEIDELHAENAELRDGMLALSNRIEAATRGWQPRREEARCRYCKRTRTFTEGKCDVCDSPIVGVGRPL